jgi:hypothetical protein
MYEKNFINLVNSVQGRNFLPGFRWDYCCVHKFE